MSNKMKYELKTNHEILTSELDNIVAYDKVNNLYIVGCLSFFGTLSNIKVFKKLKKALSHFFMIV